MTTPDRREMVDEWDIARVSVARLGDEGWSCTWQIACALTQFFADVARCEARRATVPGYVDDGGEGWPYAD